MDQKNEKHLFTNVKVVKMFVFLCTPHMVSVCPAITINLNIQYSRLFFFCSWTFLVGTLPCTEHVLCVHRRIYYLAVCILWRFYCIFCCDIYDKRFITLSKLRFRQLWVPFIMKGCKVQKSLRLIQVAFMSFIFILGDVFCYRLQQGHRCLSNSHLLKTEDSRVLPALYSKVRIIGIFRLCSFFMVVKIRRCDMRCLIILSSTSINSVW